MNRTSLETDLESQKPNQDILPGLGLGKSSIFFIFSYVVLANILKRGIDGLETVFIGVVVVGTFYVFLRKYDSDEMEARFTYVLNSLSFWLFSRGVKCLNIIKDVREDHFILQNGGVRAVLEVTSSIELSSQTHERVERLLDSYSHFLETFSSHFQVVVRIRRNSPKDVVKSAFGNADSSMARAIMENLGEAGFATIKIYLVFCSDPLKWYYLEGRKKDSLRKRLEEQVSSCMSFLARAEFAEGFRRLEGDELLDFVFDENFFQQMEAPDEQIARQGPMARVSLVLHAKIDAVKQLAKESHKVSGITSSPRYRLLAKKLSEVVKDIRLFFQVGESSISHSIRAITDFHVDKGMAYFNGVYAKTLLARFLPEREPSLLVKELLQLNRDIDISVHLYPDEGMRIRKILGRHYRTLAGQIEELSQKGGFSLTADYQEKQLKEIYYSSLGGSNLFLATTLVSVYESTPKKLNESVELVKKALRPAGLIVDPLTFRQEQALFSSVPLGMNRIERFTASDVTKIAEGGMPFIEKKLKPNTTGIPLGIVLKEGG